MPEAGMGWRSRPRRSGGIVPAELNKEASKYIDNDSMWKCGEIRQYLIGIAGHFYRVVIDNAHMPKTLSGKTAI